MNIIATHINYYFVCKRKLWLFANGVNINVWLRAKAIAELFQKSRLTIIEYFKIFLLQVNWMKIQYVGISDILPKNYRQCKYG